MQYVVQTVGDDELPEGMDRVAVERPDGTVILFINGAPARCWAFMQSVQDMWEPTAEPTILFPDTRPLLHAV